MTVFGKLSFEEAMGLIETRLAEAARTLTFMRLARHDMPDGYFNAWPDVIHDWMAYGGEVAKQRQKDAVNQPAAPSPDAVDRMDQALKWLWVVKRGDRPLIIARATGLSWRQIEDRDGRGVKTLQTVHQVALEAIFRSLIEGETTYAPTA